MNARRDGNTVTLTMTAKEAAELENELLWSTRDDDQHMKQAYEVLSDLTEDTK